MPTKSRNSANSEPERPAVTLIDVNDNETTVHTTIAFNNLVYGQGYRPKTGSIGDAYALLLEATAKATDPDAPVPMIAE